MVYQAEPQCHSYGQPQQGRLGSDENWEFNAAGDRPTRLNACDRAKSPFNQHLHPRLFTHGPNLSEKKKKLDDEVTAVKRHLHALASQKLKLKNNFFSLSGRPRRVNVLEIELAGPPEPQLAITTDSSSSAPIPLTFKSLNPALVFNCDCGHTSPIAELKQQLASSAESEPPVDSQRWLYKGEALADNELSKEYHAIKQKKNYSLDGEALQYHGLWPNQTEVEEAQPSVLPSASSSRSASISAHRPSNPTLGMIIPKITMDSLGGLSGKLQSSLARGRVQSTPTSLILLILLFPSPSGKW